LTDDDAPRRSQANMMQKACLVLALAAASLSTASAAECSRTTLDFAILQGDAAHEAYAADIAAELAELGLTLNIKPLEKDALNAAMVGGDYDLVFSETWGAPYDPHSYVKSWTSPDEAHYSALPTVGIDPEAFTAEVDAIFADMDEASRRDKWAALLSEVHGEVLHLPLWGKRIPAVVNNQRLSGYLPGAQQFDYPLHKARVVSGPKTVTVAPGAQTGLFTSVGRLDAHSYRPNEFFANNWVYEGLLAYGAGGKVEPALATSWTSEASADGGETFRFTLREGVTFHDGAEFNCAAVKLNFDHVFVEELTTGDWHGWYGLPGVYKESSCDGETFVLTTKTPCVNGVSVPPRTSRRWRAGRATADRVVREQHTPTQVLPAPPGAHLHPPAAHALADGLRRHGPCDGELVPRTGCCVEIKFRSAALSLRNDSHR
jgi:nickel transport system substrate-binding protein